MSDNSKSSSGGIGFVGLLTIVFITLKLTHYIDWSWWWVLSPVWIIALTSITAAVVAICYWLHKAVQQESKKSTWEEKIEELQRVKEARDKNSAS